MAIFYVKRNRQSKLQMIVKHMKHSIKPYSKDISEVQWAFYKSTMDYLIPAWCIKERDNCIFTPSWFLPTGFALTFQACLVLPLLFPSWSLECPLTVWPKLWKFITNSYQLRKMQIRYQNVQINITSMCTSFALRTKAPFKLPEVINVINIIKNKKV